MKREMLPVRYDVMLFDRAKDYPDGIAMISTNPRKDHTYRETYLKAYNEREEKYSYFRNDIALINGWDANGNYCEGSQTVVEARYNKETKKMELYGAGLPYCSTKQIRELNQIAQRMLKLAIEYPEYDYAMRVKYR